MKVLPFDKILQSYKKELVNEDLTKQMNQRYIPSSKVSKLNKKKALLSKITFEINFKNTTQSDKDTKLKTIIIALNKLNADSKNDIFEELKAIDMTNSDLMWKVVDFIYRKVLNESNYVKLYLDLVAKLSTYRNWTAEFRSKCVRVQDMLVLKVQEQFENNILTCDKPVGVRIITLIAKLLDEGWIPNEVVNEILSMFLEKSDITYFEYVIFFLKTTAKFQNRQEFVAQLKKTPKLPSRLAFMIEEEL